MHLVLLLALLAADEPAPNLEATAQRVRFFESRVRPILVEQCQKCHGSQKQWGSLRLDSREAILRGGDSGPAVVPGKPDESLLIRAVRHVDQDLKMPQDGKLSDRQIADLTQWVADGAVYGQAAAGTTRVRNRNHWAFIPPERPAVPTVRQADWPHVELDCLVLARLEAAELVPAAKPDPRTILRRVTFDLTGLPPDPDELAEFLADEGPDAYSRVVDRLLASPRYGQRWGRHWLDVARYADSNGLDENVAHGNAWRYRDYVVGAWNGDKPFNQMIVEQLAGDLLPADSQARRHEQLTATGFLGIGAKVLAEVDQAKMRMDIVDEQIDTVGRALLGLTLGCARCHDHKFDPIDTADYYGLAGIFKSTKSMETYTKVAKWHENQLESPESKALRADYDRRLAAKKAELDQFIATADQQARAGLSPGEKPPEKLETLYPEATKEELKKLREALAALEKSPPELPAAMGVTEDQIADVAIHVRGNPLKLGDVAPRHVPDVLRGPAPRQFTATESGRRQLADWLIDARHPLTARVFVNRVWRWHFGRGLVRSTENFGLLGEPPTNPELLDWLALRFMADGWSVKSLHRLILLSGTYQQGSVPTGPAMEKDPDNLLWSRYPVRRLEAEAVRDALLWVGGRLDLTMGGPSLAVKNREYLFDHTSKDLTTYNSPRRSLYLPIIRNNVYDLFQLLDFPDPAVTTGDRASTTVAPQALLMMNSELVMQAGSDLAGRLLSGTDDDARRLVRLYETALGREPSAAERQADLEFLAQLSTTLPQPDEPARRAEAWAALCHVLLASNEFLYVR